MDNFNIGDIPMLLGILSIYGVMAFGLSGIKKL